MTAQSIVCGACAAEVPNGRLSCQACGELLASVAGRRSAKPSGRASSRAAGSSSARRDPATPPPPIVVEGQLSLDAAPRDVEAELPWMDVDTDPSIHPTGPSPSSLAVPFGTAAILSGTPTPSYMPRPGLGPVTAPSGTPRPPTTPPPSETPPADDLESPAAAVPAPAVPAPAIPAPAVAAPAAAVAPDVPTGPAPTPSRPPIAAAATPAFAGPGAYVPPMPVVAATSAAMAPAREWAGHAAAPTSHEADAAPTESAQPDEGRARLLEFARWLSVAGSAFAAVGFLLPWGLVVIGSSDPGYFGRWGIAGPWHIVVALAILANLGLALIDNGIPVWLRTGVTGLGLGALLLGLVWPYLALPALGTGPGAIIAGVGAAALTVSGILALVTDRHDGAPRPV